MQPFRILIHLILVFIIIQIERKVSVKVMTDGTAVGVAYWFTLHMYGGITISTYRPEAVSQPDPHIICMRNYKLLRA